MPNGFDLGINFPVTGLSNIDAANAKLDALSQKVDQVIAKLGQVGSTAAQQATNASKASSQAATQAGQAATAAAQQAAQAAKNTANSATAAYKQLLATIQQANQAMKQTPNRRSGGGGGGATGGGNSGGGGGSQGGNFFPVPGFGASPGSMGNGVLTMLGLGTGANAGFYMLRQLGGFLKDLLPDAAAAARALENVSQEMGMTVQETFKLQTAAKLAGVDLGSMSMAARKLAEAIENPGTAGKATAKVMSELGVSLHQELGGALQDIITKLAAVDDPTKRAQMAFEAFGRTGGVFLTLANNFSESQEAMKKWGLSLDDNVQSRLVKANTELEAFHTWLTLLRAKAVEGIILPIAIKTEQMGASAKGAWNWLMDPSPEKDLERDQRLGKRLLEGYMPLTHRVGVPNVPGAMANPISRSSALAGQSLLTDGSKRSIDDRLAEARSKLSNAEGTFRADTERALSGHLVGTDTYTQEKKDVQELRAEVERLEAAKKSASKIDLFPEKLQEWKDRVAELAGGTKSQVATLDEQFSRQLREMNIKPDIHNSRFVDISAYFGIVRNATVEDEQRKDNDKAWKAGQTAREINDSAHKSIYFGKDPVFGNDSTWDQGNPLYWMMHTPFPSQLPPFSANQMQRLNMQRMRGASRITAIGTASSGGNEGFNAASELQISLREITQAFAEQKQTIEETKTGAEKVKDLEQARFQVVTQSLESAIQYETQLAEIRNKQLEETKSFASGFFESVISGRPNAGTNFLSGYAHKYADTIIGNVAANTFGTMESHLTFQRNLNQPGLLGKKDASGNFQANWFGKMLAGTPFGIDPAKGNGQSQSEIMSKLSSETSDNTTATRENTQLQRDLVQIMGKIAGVDTASLPAMSGTAGGVTGSTGQHDARTGANIITQVAAPMISGISQVGRAISSGNPLDALSAVNHIIGGIGGTTGFNGRVNMGGGGASSGHVDTATGASGSPIPVTIAGGSSGSLPIAAGPQIILPNLGDTSMDRSAASSEEGLPTAASVAAETMRSIRSVGSSMGSDQAEQDVSTTSKIAKTLGSMMGGAAYGTNGYGLQAVLTGQGTNGPGSMTNLGTTQQVGAGLGLAGAAAGSTMAAIQGFGKGGARGDLEGVAGALGTAALFSGPAAPIVGGIGALTGLVAGLLPDQRQQRMDQEQKRVTQDAFIEPAARAYNFSAGSGEQQGFSLGMGSTLNAGGPTANYNFNIQAMDANSMLSYLNDNHQMFSQAMLYALANGGNTAVDAEIQWRMAHQGIFG